MSRRSPSDRIPQGGQSLTPAQFGRRGAPNTPAHTGAREAEAFREVRARAIAEQAAEMARDVDNQILRMMNEYTETVADRFVREYDELVDSIHRADLQAQWEAMRRPLEPGARLDARIMTMTPRRLEPRWIQVERFTDARTMDVHIRIDIQIPHSVDERVTDYLRGLERMSTPDQLSVLAQLTTGRARTSPGVADGFRRSAAVATLSGYDLARTEQPEQPTQEVRQAAPPALGKQRRQISLD